MIRLILLLFLFPIFLTAQTIKSPFIIEGSGIFGINDFKINTKKEKILVGNSVLIKMDENNQILFYKHYWSRLLTLVAINSVVTDIDDNIYITGNISIDATDNGERIHPEEANERSGRNHIGLIKYDSKGKLLWYKIFESDYIGDCKLAIDDEQNIYLAGNHAMNRTLLPTSIDSIKSVVGSYDDGVHEIRMFFAKFDANGTTKFVKYISGYDFTRINELLFDNTKKVLYSTGHFSGGAILGKDTLKAVGKYSSHYFLCQMDKAGKFNWATQALSASSSGRGICTDTKGDIYVAGNYTGERISISNVLSSSNSLGAEASFIAKYTDKGQVIWIKHLDPQGIGLVNVQDIKIDQSSNLWVAGSFRGNRMLIGEKTFQNESLKQGFGIPSDNDIFIAKYNTAGNVLNAFHFGGKGGEAATKILPSMDKNSVYFSGYFYDNTPVWKLGNFEFEAPYYNSFFCEMKEEIVGLEEVEKAKINFKMYPNPATQMASIHFEAQATSKVQISITDISGKVIDSFPYMAIVGHNELNLVRFAAYPTGVLFCTLKFANNERITETIIKY